MLKFVAMKIMQLTFLFMKLVRKTVIEASLNLLTQNPALALFNALASLGLFYFSFYFYFSRKLFVHISEIQVPRNDPSLRQKNSDSFFHEGVELEFNIYKDAEVLTLSELLQNIRANIHVSVVIFFPRVPFQKKSKFLL
jgi:hypothetical protein